MPKFIDGYQTTLGSRVNTTKINDALNEALIKDNLITSSLDLKKVQNGEDSVYPVFITALQDSEEKIPLFSHPYFFIVKHGSHAGKKILASDMRLYLKKKVFDGNLATLDKAIVNKVEFDFARSREILNLEWIEGDVESMKTNLWFSTLMFTRWIADILTKAYALDGRDQVMISIAASYYYQSLFTDELTHSEETLEKWVIHTEKVTHAERKTINEVFSKMPEIKGFESLIEAIKIATTNVRLKDINVLTLLTLLKNSWFGTNARDILPIATEHPPTWMAIIYASMAERTYRNSLIYRIAERVGKRGLADAFMRNYENILLEYEISDTYKTLVHAGIA